MFKALTSFFSDRLCARSTSATLASNSFRNTPWRSVIPGVPYITTVKDFRNNGAIRWCQARPVVRAVKLFPAKSIPTRDLLLPTISRIRSMELFVSSQFLKDSQVFFALSLRFSFFAALPSSTNGSHRSELSLLSLTSLGPRVCNIFNINHLGGIRNCIVQSRSIVNLFNDWCH